MATVESVLQQGIESHVAGNLATAAQCYAAVLQAEPRTADAWHLAGLVAHQSGRSQDGLRYIETAIELNPNDSEYYSNLAAVYRALQQPKASLSAADSALKLDPDFATAWHQRGAALLDLDRTQDAIQSFQRAMDAGHPAASTCHDIGLALQYAGDAEGSIEHLNKSLQANPRQPIVYFRLANLVRTGMYTFDDSQRSVMHEMIKSSSTPPKDMGRLHFALATDHETRGEYADAFEHFCQGNRCYCEYLAQQKRVKPDRQAFQRLADTQIDLFGSDGFERQRAGSLTGPSPVFVVGMPRSGTTLITQMLARHSQISSAGELPAIGTLIAHRRADCANPTAAELLDQQWLQMAAEAYVAALTARSDGTALVVDKMPENFKHLGFIACLFPEAKIIHCRRDSRDVCMSAFCQLFESDRLQMETADLASLGQNYRHYLRLMDHWQRVLPVDIHEVRYEQLLEDPEGQVRQLLDYLGVPWSDACLNFHEQRSSVRTASSLQVRKPLYRSSLERWKRYEPHLGELLQALGDAVP